MTTLAIIGGGIVGRSLLYALAEEKISFDKIMIFESEPFALPCSRRSTAIVASRGVSPGHSPLGDLLCHGFSTFKEHVNYRGPSGIFPISHYTAAWTKLEAFKKRYPQGEMNLNLGALELKEEVYVSEEPAFMIDPPLYLEWLKTEAEKKCLTNWVTDFVIDVKSGEKISIHTQNGGHFEADHVVFCTGAHSRHWKKLFPETRLAEAKMVQGSYLEFSDISLSSSSFSVALEGLNFIYQAHSKKILMGSTTDEFNHQLAPVRELKKIYDKFESYLKLDLPDFNSAQVLVGHREKASKREPYLLTKGNLSCIGGMYKNGFTLSLALTRTIARQLRVPA